MTDWAGIPTVTSVAEELGPPDTPTDIPKQHFERYYRDTYTQLRNLRVPALVAHLIAGLMLLPTVWLMVAKDLVIIVLKVMLPSWGAEILDALDDLRKAIDEPIAKLAVDVLNELLGTDISPSDIPRGGAFGDHLARAERVGGILHDVLLKEFLSTGSVTPASGRDAARRFTGLMINFGTATGVLAALGGLVPQVHLDEIREIGEQVAQNLGLGRLGRQALRPLIQATVEEPYKWWVYEQARPTQLSIHELVNPFTQQVMSPTIVHDTLARQGYSDDKIAAIIELHQRKLSESDFFLLYQLGLKSDQEFQDYLSRLGYSDHDAIDRKEAEKMRSEHAIQNELLATLLDSYKFGNISRDELEALVKTIRPLANEAALTMIIADYKRKVPHRSLTLAELTSMLEMDIVDLAEFDDYLTALGYAPADVDNLRIWTLLKINNKSAAAKAKAAKASAKTAKKQQVATGSTPPTTP